MEEKVIDYFSKFVTFSLKEKEMLREMISIDFFKKGSVLLKEGKIPKDNYFIVQGCVRQYVSDEGEEKTIHFYTENEWILPAVHNYFNAIPSTYYLACIEDSYIMIGNEEYGAELIQEFSNFQKAATKIMEEEIKRQTEQFSAFITHSPEQRYLNLLENNPGLINRVPQYQLASYIGVKPESLSRIIKRIHRKGK
jgi:CRP-like cAMP-binding protein